MEEKVETNGPEWRRNPWPPFAKEEITLRDYFAAKAMQSILTLKIGTREEIVERAYGIAEAMLKARK